MSPNPMVAVLVDDEALAAVEDLMVQLCAGERLDWLGPVVREHLAAGGKRLRVHLALAATAAMGRPRAEGVAWAAACELLHNASLVHDDIQDGDRYRRGALTVWARHGVPQGINAGDLLLMLPYRAIEHAPVDDATRWQLSRAMARGAEVVVRGQAMELNLARMGLVDQPAYEEAVCGKTAALFGLPVHGAAIVAGWDVADAEALAASVSLLGLAFQIQDDVLDAYGDKERGRPGADLEEGRVTALVVKHLALHPAEAPALLALLRADPEATDPARVDDMLRRFLDGGALGAVWGWLDDIERRLRVDPLLERLPDLRRVILQLYAVAVRPIAHTRRLCAPDVRLRSAS